MFAKFLMLSATVHPVHVVIPFWAQKLHGKQTYHAYQILCSHELYVCLHTCTMIDVHSGRYVRQTYRRTIRWLRS